MIRDDDYYEALEEDRARRFAANVVCGECLMAGGHFADCPEAPDEDEEEDE